MRKTLYTHLTSQAALTAIVPAIRWFGAGAVVDTPTKPFVVVRWIAPVRGDARGTFAHQLRLDCHEPRGSYAKSDALLLAVTPIMKAVQQLEGSDGRICQCDYLGHSGDQEDPTYGTSYRFSSWQVIGVQT
jgi:hypothetical protein